MGMLEDAETIVTVADAGFASLLHFLGFDLVKCVVIKTAIRAGRESLRATWQFVVPEQEFKDLEQDWLKDKVGVTDARELMKSSRVIFDLRAKARTRGKARPYGRQHG